MKEKKLRIEIERFLFAFCYLIFALPSYGALSRHFEEKAALVMLRPSFDISMKERIELDLEPTSDLLTSSFVSVEERREEQLLSIHEVLSLDEYLDQRREEDRREIWLGMIQKSQGEEGGQPGGEGVLINLPVKFPGPVKGIIGEGAKLNIRGSQEIKFGARKSFFLEKIQTETSRQSPLPELLMQQRLNVKLDGTVGEKVHVLVDHDSERLSQLDNKIRLQYIGEEDEVIQKIEAGHTSLSLPGGTRLIGAPPKHDGLFGIQTQAKVGPVDLTAIASRDQGEAESFRVTGGAKLDTVTIPDYQFIPWRFFVIEEDPDWVVTDVKVFLDDGNGSNNEPQAPIGYATYPFGDSTEHYLGSFDLQPLTNNFHIEFKEINQIHLIRSLSEQEVLAVSYIRALRGNPAIIDTIGDFLNNYTRSDTITYNLKLIRPQSPQPNLLTWDLALKNIYSIGSITDPDSINLRIYLRNPEGGVDRDVDPDTNVTFLTLLGLDKEGNLSVPGPDGRVDRNYLEPARGLLIFPNPFPFADSVVKYPDPAIYDTTNIGTYQGLYYLKIVSKRSETTFNLGKGDIMEGSEVVRLNGRDLKKDVDYSIDYDFGEVALIGNAAEEGARPDSRVEIDFQYAPFFSLTSKSLLGMRGDYAFENGRIGSSWMFRSEGAPERIRQRLGEESTRILMGEVDGQYSLQPELFTRIADAVPLVETDAPSNLTVSVDAASSFPNPSVTGQGYVDDMEGSLISYDLGIQRTSWFFGSIPSGVVNDTNKLGYLQWYNPYDRVLLKDLEENLPSYRENERKDYLNLVFSPKGGDPSSWGSIAKAISAVEPQDFSQHKYIELWVKGGKGVLHIDIGEWIPEDAFWRHAENDQVRGIEGRDPDTEDQNNNNTLDAGEDIGVDKIADGKPGDWPNDNYSYDQNNPDDYSHINGTEGNNRLDTDDLNHNGFIEDDKEFFSFTLDLSKNDFVVIDRLNETGWRLFRINLTDPSVQSVGVPNWKVTRYLRLWLDGFDEQGSIGIASLEIVGNRWRMGDVKPLPDTLDSLSHWRRSDYINPGLEPRVKFEITTKNNERDPDYTPPIEPRKDAFGRPERESSLVLKYDSLPPESQGYTYFQFNRAQDFTYYKTLSFYLHGPISGEPTFSFRVGGINRNNHYEYKKANLGNQWYRIDLPLSELTRVRKGNPSLREVWRMELAVENPSSLSISGEVWIDEIRLMDPRRDPGVSANLGLSTKFGDLLDWNLNLRREDEEYRTLSRKIPNNTLATSLGTGGNLQLSKFLPEKWGIGMPLALNYSRSRSLPKYRTGSDQLIQGDERDKEQSLAMDRGASISVKRQATSGNPWGRLFLDPFQIRTSYSERFSSSPTNLDTTRSTSGSLSYGYSPRLPILKPLKGLEFSYFPDNLSFSTGYSRTRSASLSITQADTSQKTVTLQEKLTPSGSAGMKPMQISTSPFTLQSSVNYAVDFNRDLIHPLRKELAGINIGEEVTRGQRVHGNLSSSILDLLDPSFTYNTRYDENHGLEVGGLEKDLRDVGNVNTREIRTSFNLPRVMESIIPDPDTGKVIEPGSPLWILKGIESVSQKISPPQAGFSRTNQSAFSWLDGRPPLSYQLGFSKDLGDVRQDPSTTRLDVASAENRYDLGSGIAFGNLSINLSLRGGNSEGGNRGQKTWSNSLTWPLLDLTLSGLERRGGLNRFLQSANFRTSFSQEKSKSGSFNNEVKQDPSQLRSQWSLGPSLQATWKKGITSGINADFENTRSESPLSLSETKGNSQSYSLTVGYGLRAPGGIQIPIFGKVRFKSTLDLKLTTQYTTNFEKSVSQFNPEGTINQHLSTLSITPNASYAFSQSLTGSLELGFRETNNKRQGFTNRDFSLNFSVLFRF